MTLIDMLLECCAAEAKSAIPTASPANGEVLDSQFETLESRCMVLLKSTLIIMLESISKHAPSLLEESSLSAMSGYLEGSRGLRGRDVQDSPMGSTPPEAPLSSVKAQSQSW